MNVKREACIELAFRDTTPEGEAIAAFLALRRFKYHPGNTNQQTTSSYSCNTSTNKSDKGSYELTISYGPIQARYADYFISVIVKGCNVYDCRLNDLEIEGDKIISPKKIRIKVSGEMNDLENVQKYIRSKIDWINQDMKNNPI